MLKDYMLSIGYSENDIEVIRNTYGVKKLKDASFYKRFLDVYNFFKEFGYTNQEIIKITRECPSLCVYTKEKIAQKIDNFKRLGYGEEEIIKMTVCFPQLYSLMEDNIVTKVIDLEKLGYKREEIINMTKSFPNLFSSPINKIKKRLEDLEGLGFTKEAVLEITRGLPTLFCLSLENISSKVDYFRKIGIDFVILLNPKYLIQSINLTYVRYEFLRDMEISVNDDNNWRFLFFTDKYFEKRFKITRAELLERYDYNECKEERNNALSLQRRVIGRTN